MFRMPLSQLQLIQSWLCDELLNGRMDLNRIPPGVRLQDPAYYISAFRGTDPKNVKKYVGILRTLYQDILRLDEVEEEREREEMFDYFARALVMTQWNVSVEEEEFRAFIQSIKEEDVQRLRDRAWITEEIVRTAAESKRSQKATESDKGDLGSGQTADH